MTPTEWSGWEGLTGFLGSEEEEGSRSHELFLVLWQVAGQAVSTVSL